jgi:hypothetical protein
VDARDDEGARVWLLLALVAVAALVVQMSSTHATAWHFFDDASRLLLGRDDSGSLGGLRLYADHPEFQFGPLSIVVAAPFARNGTVGITVAMVAFTALGLATFSLIVATARAILRSQGSLVGQKDVFVAGVVFVLVWNDVAARTAHIDDALALFATAVALRLVSCGRAGWCVVALAVAAAAKPWAIAFAPLVFAVDGTTARRVGRLASVGLLAGATWLPFLIAEPGTLDVRHFTIANDPTSVLRALGVTEPVTPDWARHVQLAGGVVVAAVLVLVGRWHAAVLGAVAWRLLFEPGANRYYTVALVLGVVLVELVERPGRIPWLVVTAALVLEATATPGFPGVPGRYLRLAVVLGALVAAFRSKRVGVVVPRVVRSRAGRPRNEDYPARRTGEHSALSRRGTSRDEPS